MGVSSATVTGSYFRWMTDDGIRQAPRGATITAPDSDIQRGLALGVLSN